MKTIEEKAKAYDNIIEKANKMHNENCEACQMCIEELIPEFKESEDEKIRKQIKAFIKSRGSQITQSKTDAWLAWLEGQGEKDKEILVLKGQIESLRSAIKAIKETYKIELEKQGKLNTDNSIWHKVEPKEYVLEKTLICKENGEIDLVEDTILSVTGAKYALPVSSLGMPKSLEKQGEQKPVEKSDVYPPTLNEAIDLYYYSYGNGKGGFDKLSLEKFRDIVKTFVEDYSKQKTIDKVKPKFKVGD